MSIRYSPQISRNRAEAMEAIEYKAQNFAKFCLWGTKRALKAPEKAKTIEITKASMAEEGRPWKITVPTALPANNTRIVRLFKDKNNIDFKIIVGRVKEVDSLVFAIWFDNLIISFLSSSLHTIFHRRKGGKWWREVFKSCLYCYFYTLKHLFYRRKQRKFLGNLCEGHNCNFLSKVQEEKNKRR